LIPLPRTLVPGCETSNIVTTCVVKCRPRFLFVPREVAGDFEIVSIIFGRNSQAASAGEIPAAAFAGDLVINQLTGNLDLMRDLSFERVLLDHPVPIKFDDCDRGDTICLMVRNLNCGARNFTGLFYGEPLE
jgi:hypothetical protein